MQIKLSIPTQRYYRIAVSTFFFIQGIVFASWASRIPDIKNMLGLSDAGLGAVLFSLPMGQLTAMTVSGILVSKFGSKTTLSIAAVFYPLALVGIGSAHYVWQLSLALYFFGIAGNICNISINTQGVGVERIYRRSIMASFHGIWSLAGFIAGLFSTWIVSMHITPFVHYIIIFLTAFTLMSIVRSSVLPRDVSKNQASEKRKMFVMPDKYIVVLGIVAFGSMICEGTMFDWSSIYFEKVLKLPNELIRIGYIAFMLTMATGRFAADKLVTRFGVDNVLKFSGITIFTGLMTAIIFPYLYSATLGFLLVGAGTSSVVPLCYSNAGKSKRILPGMALAMVSSIGFLGFLLGPPLIGFIAQLFNLRWSFAFVAMLGLIITLMSQKLNQILENE